MGIFNNRPFRLVNRLIFHAEHLFVFNWARYRYGVFEEFGYPGDELYPMFYLKHVDGNKPAPEPVSSESGSKASGSKNSDLARSGSSSSKSSKSSYNSHCKNSGSKSCTSGSVTEGEDRYYPNYCVDPRLQGYLV